MTGLALFPALAAAHGPINPVATDYVARVATAPAGLHVIVVDGDQAMWMSVPARATVLVLDPRGAPYLRFTPAGVAVNTNSEDFYTNQSPVPETPPAGLTRATPPAWQPVSSAHAYRWHEGRLHAPAALVRPASGGYAGAFSIPLVIDGRPAAVTGGVYYTAAPSIVWFWPIGVLLACLLAVRRLRDPQLDRRSAALLSGLVLVAIVVAALARDLHGRPGLSGFSVAELLVTLAVVAWAVRRVIAGRAGFMTAFALAFVALWEGLTLLPSLTHGYTLVALPTLAARLATVACLGGGLGLLVASMRLAEDPARDDEAPLLDDDLDVVGDLR